MKNRKKIVLICILAAVVLAAGLTAGIVYLVRINDYKQKVAALTISEIDLRKVRDGVYTGECDVGVLYAKATVTVSGGAVTEIILVRHKNERGEAAESIPAEIVRTQTFPASVVTGATNSSRVILKAIENALTQGL